MGALTLGLLLAVSLAVPSLSRSGMASAFTAPAGRWVALDCDLATPGIQDACMVPNVAGTAVDIGVYYGDSGNSGFDVSSFNFDILGDQRSRLNPNPCTTVAACTSAPALNGDPDFDETGPIGALGSWDCSLPPVNPNLGPTDTPPGVGVPPITDSFISCFTVAAGPVTTAAPMLMAVVHYTVPVGATGGPVNVTIANAAVGDSTGFTPTISCGYADASKNTETCVGAVVTVVPAAQCAAIARADVTGDGVVSISDLGKVALWFGQDVPPAPASYDQTGDNKITIGDVGKQALVFGMHRCA